MSKGTDQIGFSQRIRIEWLERTADLVLAGNERKAIISSLQELLAGKLSIGGKAKRGNREKAITILMKTWVTVPHDLTLFRDAGLDLLRRLPEKDHLPIHWGMTMATYPFWGFVAATVGRLLRLQGSASTIQIQRRIREKYGERETVSRATRRLIRSFVDWGVLADSTTKGICMPAAQRPITDPDIITWLIEALLHARTDGAAALKSLLGSPSLFPFSLGKTSRHHFTVSGRMEVISQGPDEDLVTLQLGAGGREKVMITRQGTT